MWVCLRENCVIDDSTGVEKMNYEDFFQIASICAEQVGPKCKRFFCPSNFMKFEKGEAGRIAILPFYLYVMRTVSLTQARIDMSELDEDGDGFLQPHEMEAYIRGLIPNLAQLRDMPSAFLQMYCRIAAHKFFFFCDPYRRGKLCIKKVLLSNCLAELMELHQENEEEVADSEQGENWFSLTTAQRICDMFLGLDKDMNGTLSKQELREYADGTLTDIFIERVFDEHIRRGKSGGGNCREMDFDSFLDFVLALENKDTPEGLTYLFRRLDLDGRGCLTTTDIHTLFRDVHQKWIEGEYATENSLFGQADVSYRLKQIFQPKNEALALQSKTESLKLSRIQSEEVSPSLPAVTQEDMAPVRSLDRYGVPETPIESTPKSTLQLRPMVQLKSCLKKADELGNGTLKETARVTFQLDSGELSRTVVTAMDEHSQKENVNIPISTSLLLENNAIVNSLVENDATESAPPDISHQMLYLLMQCNDIVNEISTSLGYVPLHEL